MKVNLCLPYPSNITNGFGKDQQFLCVSGTVIFFRVYYRKNILGALIADTVEKIRFNI